MDGSRLKRRSTAQQPLPHSRGIENIALKRRVQTNFLVKSKGAWRSFSDTFRRGQYSGVHVPKGTKYEPVVEISRTPKIVGKALAGEHHSCALMMTDGGQSDSRTTQGRRPTSRTTLHLPHQSKTSPTT